MRGTRRHALASGSVWVVVLATVAWGALELSGERAPVGHGAQIVAAAPVIDTTAPQDVAVAGGPNAEGWYHEPADYIFTAQDSESGIASCDGGAVEPVESAVPTTIYGTCTNGAGLPGPYEGFAYRYDGTRPTLDPVVTRSVVTRFGVVVARARAQDVLSGVARQSCNGNRGLSTRRLGLHTVSCVAQDRAGNIATATVSYVVVDPPRSRG
jgi:hypothetical protein